MQKVKRILAMIGVILLLGMYLVTFVLGVTGSPETKGLLMASCACTVIVPGLLYAFMLVARILSGRTGLGEEQIKEQIRKAEEEKQ